MFCKTFFVFYEIFLVFYETFLVFCKIFLVFFLVFYVTFSVLYKTFFAPIGHRSFLLPLAVSCEPENIFNNHNLDFSINAIGHMLRDIKDWKTI